MKVLFYSWEYPPNGSGVASYVRNMSQALILAGHHVVVFTGKAEGYDDDSNDGGVRVLRRYDRCEVGAPKVADMVFALAKSDNVDLIEGADHLGECAELMRMSGRPPIMIKLHSCNAVDVLVRSQILYAWQNIMVQASLFRCRAQRRREQKCITDADIAVAPSQRLCDEIVKQGLRKNVHVLPNPCPVDSQTLVGEGSQPNILFVGRLDIGKGIHYLHDIMRSVLQKHPDATLTIAGSDSYARGLGSLKKWLSRRMDSSLSSVRFLGHVAPEELAEAYRKCWVVVVPSRWDNFPGSVLEAMAVSKPVVASPNGGMPEMLKDTGCIIADPASHQFAAGISAFLSDRELRETVGAKAAARVSTEYAPKKIASEYVTLVEKHL